MEETPILKTLDTNHVVNEDSQRRLISALYVCRVYLHPTLYDESKKEKQVK